MFFASDNGAPVPAQVMDALMHANAGAVMSYGNDPLTGAVRARIRDLFEAPEAAVYLVATGTAANALALAHLCPPWGAVFCHTLAHVETDECGAPEFFTAGAKLIGVPGAHGRIEPAALAEVVAATGRGGVHGVQKGALSLTNATEAGTVYAPAEIAALARIAHEAGVPVHLDGARFANALVATGATPAEMSWRAGVDILTLGGTKNGLLGAEAVILFDPARAFEFELRRKRAGHIVSKYRYLAAQFDAWLEGDLWRDMARHANAMAARLAQGLGQVAGARLVHPVEANIIFADIPRAAADRARAAGAKFYTIVPGEVERVRLVPSWATTPAEVDALIAALGG
ncbi:MAG: threonine aldolase family protein [Gemmobacter sp.]